MNAKIDDSCKYVDTHEWARQENGTIRIGISDFAQDELGDIVFVELPEIDDSIDQGEAFGVIESIKAVSDLYAPVSGTVTQVNEAVFDAPEFVNDDPFGEGWMIIVEPDDTGELDALLSPEEYSDQIA